MMELTRLGAVRANGKLAGYIRELRDGLREAYQFQYAKGYLQEGSPIGHAFPITDQVFEFDTFPPFFENLISEGWLRAHQSRNARLDKQDSFGLLLHNGEDIIGALSVIPMEMETK